MDQSQDLESQTTQEYQFPINKFKVKNCNKEEKNSRNIYLTIIVIQQKITLHYHN